MTIRAKDPRHFIEQVDIEAELLKRATDIANKMVVAIIREQKVKKEKEDIRISTTLKLHNPAVNHCRGWKSRLTREPTTLCLSTSEQLLSAQAR